MVVASSTPSYHSRSQSNPMRRPPLLPSLKDPNNVAATLATLPMPGQQNPRRPKSRDVHSRYLLSTSSSSSNSSSSNSTSSPMLPRAHRAGEMSAAARMLVSSGRSLSVSFQGESYAVPGTPMTAPRMRSKGGENSQPWPGSGSMSRSVDLGCGDGGKRRSKLSGTGCGSTAKVVRALIGVSSDVTLRTGLGGVGDHELVSAAVRRSVSEDGDDDDVIQGSGSLVSDAESVSSECNSGSQDGNLNSSVGGRGKGGGGGRIIVVPKRCWQEGNAQSKRGSEPGSPLARTSSSKRAVLPKLAVPRKLMTDSSVASSRGSVSSRGLSSPVRGTVRPATPSKLAARTAAPDKLPVRPSTPCKLPVRPASPSKLPVRPATPSKLPVRPATPSKLPVRPGTPTKLPVRPATPSKLPVRPGTPSKSAVRPGTPSKSAVRPASPSKLVVRPASPIYGTVRPASPICGTVRSASPAKLATLDRSSHFGEKSRMASPSRLRNAMPSALCFGADVRRVKVGDNCLGDVHLLRLLHNRQLQWQFVNARAESSLSIQTGNVERGLYNAWRTISDLRIAVSSKRKELQWLRQKLKLVSILKGQMLYLEEWALMDKDHCSSLVGAIESLGASIIRLPLVGGARGDIQDVKDALWSAADVMHAMASSICSLLQKVEEVNSLVAEVVSLTYKEHSLLNECKDTLSMLAAMQVKDCSLRAHKLQQKCTPSNLPLVV